MIASASSSANSLTLSQPSENTAPPSDDDSASFNDVMQQQQQAPQNQTQSQDQAASPSSSSAAQKSSGSDDDATDHSSGDTDDATNAVASTSPASTRAASPTPAPAKTRAMPVAAGSDLSAMIVQASVLASNLQQALTAKTTSPTVASDLATAQDTSKETSALANTDLASLIAQATSLLSCARPATSAKTSTAGTTSTTKDSSTTSASAKVSTASSATSSSATGTAGVDLSTLIAQAAILGSGPSTSGNDLPIATIGKGVTSVSTKEKKSATSSAGGSFLQSSGTASVTTASALALLGSLSNAVSNASANQTLTSSIGLKNSALASLAGGASSLAGTANDEDKKDMISDLNNSATQLLSETGAGTTTTQAQPDMQIKLDSTTDFSSALKQVMHVANMTQTSESRTPMRVEMEIQTPPGAIVNIYVSKSGDGLRAQLSTNDPVAMAWVQNQMTSLRQTGDVGGVEVKWAPPQMEGTSTIITSGSQDANLSWNQGGGQSGYQQSDERQQNTPNDQDDEPEFATAGGSQFMKNLTSAGRTS